MTKHRLAGPFIAAVFACFGAACEEAEPASGPKTSNDVTTTSATVAGPRDPDPSCRAGESEAVTGEKVCVRTCASADGCPDQRRVRTCGPGQMLAAAPDSEVAYCVDKPGAPPAAIPVQP